MANLHKISSFACSAIMGLMLIACGNEEDEIVPEIKMPPKAEAPAPATDSAQKSEMPILQSIESLSANSSTEGNSSIAKSDIQPGTEGAVVIQVSIQPSKSAAKNVLKKLEEKGIKGYLAQVANPGELEGSYFRVRIGYFKKIEEAKAYGKSALEPLGFAWWVDNKANDTVGSPESGESTGSYSNSDSYNTSGSYTSSTPMEPEPPAASESVSTTPEPEPTVSEPAPVVQKSEAPAEASQPAEQPESAPAVPEEPAPAPAAPATSEDVYDDWE